MRLVEDFVDCSSGLTVPYRPLSKERKAELESVLKESNRLLEDYHTQMKQNNGLKRHERTKFLAEIHKSFAGCDLLIENVVIPKKDVEIILRSKLLEWELLCGFSRQIQSLAKKWSARSSDSSISIDDFMSEAFHVAFKAIAHFSEEGACFSTYLYSCVNKRLAFFCAKNCGLSGVSNRSLALKRQYSVLAAEEGATFDSIVSKMDISEKKVRMLRSVLLGNVQNATSLEKDASELALVDDCPMDTENLSGTLKSLESVVSNAGLTELEQKVLEGFMDSSTSRLGIGSFTKKLINPKTNKPYSRMTFTYAWRRVKEKLADAYKKAA